MKNPRYLPARVADKSNFPAALVTLAVCIGAMLLTASSALASKSLIGSFGSSGTGDGQFNKVLDVAVNVTGAGGVTAGDVYAVDSGNNRIEQFTADGTFVRAFGLNVGGEGVDTCTSGCGEGAASAEAGGMSAPQGVAIDQANGNLFVTDQANRRVDVFSAEGVFEGAFGTGVKSGDAEPYTVDFCTTGTGCQAGQSGAQAGEFGAEIGFPAVVPKGAPDAGTIVVANTTYHRIDELQPTLNAGQEVTNVTFDRGFGWKVNAAAPQEELQECTQTTGCLAGGVGRELGQLSISGQANPISIAADSNGAIYAVERNMSAGSCTVTRPCRVQKFSFPAGNIMVEEFAPSELTSTSGAALSFTPYDVAADPASGHVFAGKRAGTSTTYEFFEFDDVSNSLLSVSPPGGEKLTTNSTTPGGLAVGSGERLYFVATTAQVDILGPPPAPSSSILPVTSIGTTSATFRGTVTPPPGDYPTYYHFEYSSNGITWQSWPAEEEAFVGRSNEPIEVTQEVTGLQPNATYEVRLVATTGTSAASPTVVFTTEAAAPTISATVAVSVTETTAKLTALVNPNNQATTYHFEWGPTDSYGNDIPDFEAYTGDGGQPVEVAATISALQPNTAYHFRVVATNSSGVSEGADQEVVTLDVNGLPDDRAYELVSPANKGVGETTAFEGVQLEQQISSDGESVVYPLTFGLPDAVAGGVTEYRGERTPAGWQSTELTPPAITTSRSGGNTLTGFYQYFSSDLSCGILSSEQPLAPNTPMETVESGGENMFRRNQDGSYTLLTETAPESMPAHDLFPFSVAGVSEDCEHILFTTRYVYPGVEASGLYEWDEGTLQNVGVLPDGTVAKGASPGSVNPYGDLGSPINAMSADGSLVFFTARSDQGDDIGKQALFVREDGSDTHDVSQSQTATVDRNAIFQTASTDGRRVLFIANYGLTEHTSAGPTTTTCKAEGSLSQACDLYEYNLDDHTLTDLSVDTTDSNGAMVAGVLAASDDASYVYFAAQGRLVQGQGSSFVQNQTNGTYNVYLAHEGKLAFVGRLKSEDLTSQHGAALITNITDYASWSAHATPDGHTLIFESTAIVTGYRSGGAYEVYRYSTASGETVCVSCRRDGRPSLGTTFSPPLPLSSGSNELFLHQPLAMTNDGSRVFFTSPDVLATGAVGGSPNVYEWEHGELYLLAPESTFIGAGTNGQNAFITTTAKLLSEDVDAGYDVYDMRVAGGFPEAARASTCEPLAGACQSGSPGAPQIPASGSSLFSGPGNLVPAASGKQERPSRQSTPLSIRQVRKAPNLALGTIVVVATVPGQGKLLCRGTGLVRLVRSFRKAGRHKLAVRLTRKARRRLIRKGAFKTTLTARFRLAAGKTSSTRLPLRITITRKGRSHLSRATGDRGGAK